MICVIIKRFPKNNTNKVVYKSLNFYEALNSLEVLVEKTIIELQGITKFKIFYKENEKITLNRGYYALCFSNKIVVYEKKKDTTFYTGESIEYCTFELITARITQEEILNTSVIAIDDSTKEKLSSSLKGSWCNDESLWIRPSLRENFEKYVYLAEEAADQGLFLCEKREKEAKEAEEKEKEAKEAEEKEKEAKEKK